MFARFRNLFWKIKNEAEVDANALFDNSDTYAETSVNVIGSNEESTKLVDLNYLTSIQENEQQSSNNSRVEIKPPPSSLSEEVAELLKKRLLRNEKLVTAIETDRKTTNQVSKENKDTMEVSKNIIACKDQSIKHKEPTNISRDCAAVFFQDFPTTSTDNETIMISVPVEEIKKKDPIEELSKLVNREIEQVGPSPETNVTLDKACAEHKGDIANKSENLPENNIVDPPNTETIAHTPRENFRELSKSTKSSSQSSLIANHGHSTTDTFLQDLQTNNCNNSSIVMEDLPSEITTPSPTVESTISLSTSNTSTLDSSSLSEVADPSKVIVNPIDNNGLACNAITNKLGEIAEVAESLDAVIRDVQENVQDVEVESNPSPSHKQLGTLRSASSEDWHSRSTEDDSFATASEGNFTPSSLSFRTASGTTSSYISCDKNSFDASEADDSTYAYELHELTSPLNMSFEGSEQSYLSAQPLNGDMTTSHKHTIATSKVTKGVTKPANSLQEDQSSTADIEELHSESVTPTPEDNYDDYRVESVPIESECDLEVAGIADAPSMDTLTEHTTMATSRTPEVSSSTSNGCSNQNPITVSAARQLNGQQELHNATTNNNNKPNAAWRRSKYYENITKQTIKGFL